MKKLLIGALLCTMSFSLCACGGNPTSVDEPKVTEESESSDTSEAEVTAEETILPEETEVPAEETVEEAAEPAEMTEPYIFENGVFTNHTFTVTVPEDWCLDEITCSEKRAKFLNAADKESFSVFDQPSIEIEVTDYEYSADDISTWVENDKQFFKEDLTISDATIGIYTGSALYGSSHAYVNMDNTYYDLDNWQEGTNNRSVMRIQVSNNKENPYPVETILDTLQVTLDSNPDTAADSSQEAASAEETSADNNTIVMNGFSLPLTEGWYFEYQNAAEAKIKNDKFDAGSITLTSDSLSYSKNAAEWAEDKSNSFGGGHEINTYDINGYEFVGVNPVENQYYVFHDTSDGQYVVKISTMRISLDQAADLFAGLVID